MSSNANSILGTYEWRELLSVMYDFTFWMTRVALFDSCVVCRFEWCELFAVTFHGASCSVWRVYDVFILSCLTVWFLVWHCYGVVEIQTHKMFKITVFIRTTHSMRILVLFVLICPKFVLVNSFILNLSRVGILFYQIFYSFFGLVFVVYDTVTCGVPCPDRGKTISLESWLECVRH